MRVRQRYKGEISTMGEWQTYEDLLEATEPAEEPGLSLMLENEFKRGLGLRAILGTLEAGKLVGVWCRCDGANGLHLGRGLVSAVGGRQNSRSVFVCIVVAAVAVTRFVCAMEVYCNPRLVYLAGLWALSFSIHKGN